MWPSTPNTLKIESKLDTAIMAGMAEWEHNDNYDTTTLDRLQRRQHQRDQILRLRMAANAAEAALASHTGLPG